MEILFTCFLLRSIWSAPKDSAVHPEVAFFSLGDSGEKEKYSKDEGFLLGSLFSPQIIFHIKTQCLNAYFHTLKDIFHC